MTTAKITKADGYRCAPDGVNVKTFAMGETVSGKIAEWAVADRAASRMFDPRTDTQAMTPPETKVIKEDDLIPVSTFKVNRKGRKK